MTRLLVAAVLLAAAVSPAFACAYNQSVSTETKSRVAATPPSDQSAPPPAAPAGQKPS